MDPVIPGTRYRNCMWEISTCSLSRQNRTTVRLLQKQQQRKAQVSTVHASHATFKAFTAFSSSCFNSGSAHCNSVINLPKKEQWRGIPIDSKLEHWNGTKTPVLFPKRAKSVKAFMAYAKESRWLDTLCQRAVFFVPRVMPASWHYLSRHIRELVRLPAGVCQHPEGLPMPVIVLVVSPFLDIVHWA